jgi:uncharacterized cupin superfamily protein
MSKPRGTLLAQTYHVHVVAVARIQRSSHARAAHHLINKSTRSARVLEIVNSDARDRRVYSDIDMVVGPGSEPYRHRDGTHYPRKPG